LPGPRSWG